MIILIAKYRIREIQISIITFDVNPVSSPLPFSETKRVQKKQKQKQNKLYGFFKERIFSKKKFFYDP